MSSPFLTTAANAATEKTTLAAAQVWETDTGRMVIAEASGTQYPISQLECYEFTFTEVTGDGSASTYVATQVVPAGYSVVDIAVGSTVVWDAATSAALKIGDADSATGYVSSLNVKTTPAANTAGGYGQRILDLNGTYKYGKYYAAAGLITMTITTNDDGTHSGGRTRILIMMTRGSRTVTASTHTA